MRFELTVNGTRHPVEAPRNAPLLMILREELGLTVQGGARTAVTADRTW